MGARLAAPRRKFTADEVERMVEVGILGADEPVELLDGELVVVSPQGVAHAAIVSVLDRLLSRAYGDAAHLRVQTPIDAGPRSRPEPDLAVVRGEPRDYLERHPAGPDLLLVVEVAVTTLADARRKLPIYARAGVSVVWVLDVRRRRLEVHTGPDPRGAYGATTVLGDDDRVALPRRRGARWRVADLLP
ncbi:MAG: Uma2 family endonuclease [Planctomycetes bacterium]|nr:Uma2 family endonuclease [Planctomycetota bacterium]